RRDGVGWRQRRRLTRAIGERGGIERQQLGRAAGALLTFVKTFAALLADRSPADELLGDRRQRELAGFVRRQLRLQVPHDVTEHVEARDIHRPERRALRTAKRGTGDGINLLDRERSVLE